MSSRISSPAPAAARPGTPMALAQIPSSTNHEQPDVCQDQPRDEIAERDIGDENDRPTFDQTRVVEERDQADKGESRNDRESQRCDQRQHRPSPRVQHAAGGSGLRHLLHDQAEEQDHTHVVDEESKGKRRAEIALGQGIGPHQRNENASGEDQENRLRSPTTVAAAAPPARVPFWSA